MPIRQHISLLSYTILRPVTRLTVDHLWVTSLLALVWLFISILPLPPNDLWWHMAAGRTMVAEGAWMHTNRWAYTMPYDAAYALQSWLSEVVLYALWYVGDVPLLTLARTLVIVGSYGLVAWHALRRVEGQGKPVALALFMIVAVGWNNWTLRPQTLALLPGAAFVVVLGEYLDGRISARWLFALPLLMVVWVNMHGSFILGLALLALAWCGLALTAIRRLRTLEAAEWRRLRHCTYVGVATLLVTVIHPLGTGIFGYVRDLFINQPVQQNIIEWQPPRNELNLFSTGFWFFAILLLLAVLMAAGPRRPSAIDLLWYTGMGWLAIGGQRHAMWFGLFMMPLLAEQLVPLFKPRQPATGNLLFNVGYGLLLCIGLVALLPWFLPGRYLGPGAEALFANTGPYRLLLSRATPIGASDWLAEHPIEGRFWTDMSYSSYTIWQLPEKQIFTDLRIDLFPEAIWKDYYTISQGDQQSLAMIDKWQITHLMLSQEWQKSLYQLLRNTPGWCERYSDRDTAIMARCTS
jgi:hypothetical protein